MHDSFRSTRTVQDRVADVPDRRSSGAAGQPADLAEPFLGQISRIRRYTRDGYIAPNKPVTLLWALARLEEGEPRLAPYASAEQELQPLLDAYAPRRTSPIHAFWALRNDGFWEVVWKGEMVNRRSSVEPTVTSSRAHASGGFRKDAFDLLVADPSLRRAAEASLLEQIRAGAGPGAYVPPPAGARESVSRIARHGGFRRGAMKAFDSRCAVCGWGMKKNGSPVALTAAHVHSLEEEGPDEAGNGLVLCWFHHTLFDAGLFSYDEQRRLIVSSSWREEDRGGMPSLHDYAGGHLPEPGNSLWRVRDVHLEWHRRNVFTL